MADWDDSERLLERTIEIDCPSCGSRLHYAAEHRMLRCNHCGYKEDFSKESDGVVEVDLHAALHKLGEYVPEQNGRSIYECKGCSARFGMDEGQTRIICAFCGSEKVNVEAFEHRYVQPSGILPFQIPRVQASDSFKNWIRKGWFHPNSLKKLAEIDSLHGVYIPFWTFDAMTQNRWTGEAGYYYYETMRVQVNGQWQTKQVRKVRWVPRSGQFQHFFDDVVVSASRNLTQRFLDRILPFELNQVVNFDARLMIGWESEVYSVELDEGWKRGEGIIEEQIRMMVIQALGGDTQRNLHVRTSKSNETYKHVILPVWLASYRYRDKIYRFVVNGQNGKVYGDKPIAWWKVILLITLFLAVLAGIYFVREANL